EGRGVRAPEQDRLHLFDDQPQLRPLAARFDLPTVIDDATVGSGGVEAQAQHSLPRAPDERAWLHRRRGPGDHSIVNACQISGEMRQVRLRHDSSVGRVTVPDHGHGSAVCEVARNAERPVRRPPVHRGGRATRCNSSANLGSRHSLEPLNSMRRKEMTTTIERPQLTADEIATRWLQDFESALSRRDIPAAAGLFAAASYWRDLVSFTWNLKTVENPDGVTDLLGHNLDRVSPADFELSEPAATADGVTEA